MDQRQLNQLRRMAGLPENYSYAERVMLEQADRAEKNKKQELKESANGARPPEKKLKELCKRHCNVKDTESKELHSISGTTLLNALN